MKTSQQHESCLKIDNEKFCTDIFPGFSPVSTFTKPSMETFYCDIFKPKIPALLEGMSILQISVFIDFVHFL